MASLFANKGWILICWVAFAACTTPPQYRISAQDQSKVEVTISPDRIILECQDVADPEESPETGGRFGFMMHILDEQDTVMTAVQFNFLGQSDCKERLTEIGKIIREGKSIVVAGRGDLNVPRVKESTVYAFPEKGSFASNGRTLHFQAIWNQKGQCYDTNYGIRSPCPRAGFPISKP